jgi:hypothetical protein
MIESNMPAHKSEPRVESSLESLDALLALARQHDVTAVEVTARVGSVSTKYRFDLR